MTHVLAIGKLLSHDRDAIIEAFDPVLIDDMDDLADLDAHTREQVTAVAYAGHAPFDATAMDLLPNLALIANYGVGYDAIDVAAASARDVIVTNTPDVLNDDVADLAIGLWLQQGRQMRQAEALVRSGRWAADGPAPLTTKLSGRTAGIVGMGRIGRAIADRLAAFNMDIHYQSRSTKDTPGWTYHADPVALANAVDTLFVAVVGGPDTVGYVSKEVIAALGPKGVIINISRGSTIDEAALLDALESGALAGAGLDVFLNEPAIDPRFLTLDTVALQPHQGSATVQTRAAMAQLQRDNIAAHLAGKPALTPVNGPDAG